MTSSLLQKHRHFLAGALILAHLAMCFLAAWFHQHGGEEHAEVKGELYHSHVSAVASRVPDSEQEHHASPDGLHLLEGAQPFENMPTAFAGHFGQSFTAGKFAPQNDFFIAPVVENSPPGLVIKIVIKLPPIQPARDYFALTAAGLSPPLA